MRIDHCLFPIPYQLCHLAFSIGAAKDGNVATFTADRDSRRIIKLKKREKIDRLEKIREYTLF